jgi:hypothetical protein
MFNLKLFNSLTVSTVAILGFFSGPGVHADILVYKSGNHLKAINENGKEILSEFGIEKFTATKNKIAYKKGNHLKVVTDEGQEILSLFGGEKVVMSDEITAYFVGNHMKAINNSGDEILSVFGVRHFNLNGTHSKIDDE